MRQVGSHVLTFLFGPAITAQWNRSDKEVCLQFLKKKCTLIYFLTGQNVQIYLFSNQRFRYIYFIPVFLIKSC